MRGGKLGYNVKMIVEMGEEMGSPGLHAICEQLRDELRADVLIASDGPRLAAQRPTVFLGSRGLVNFKLSLNLRDGGHHSGNWGGLLRNPGWCWRTRLHRLSMATARFSSMACVRPRCRRRCVARWLGWKWAADRTIPRSTLIMASRD